MFGLFKKKRELKVTQLVWKNETLKYEGILKSIEGKGDIGLYYYFNDTKTALQTAIETYQQKSNKHLNIRLEAAQKLLSSFTDLSGDYICFAEHHPSFAKEENILTNLQDNCNVREVSIHISFDEPLFRHFGLDNILQLMEKIGLKDDEPLQNDMILKSVTNVQKKLDEITGGNTLETSSVQEWFNINIPKNQGL